MSELMTICVVQHGEEEEQAEGDGFVDDGELPPADEAEEQSAAVNRGCFDADHNQHATAAQRPHEHHAGAAVDTRSRKR